MPTLNQIFEHERKAKKLPPFDWKTFEDRMAARGEAAALALIVPGRDYDARIAPGQQTPLQYCLCWQRQSAAIKFIDCGASPDWPDPKTGSPLLNAVRKGLTKVVRRLLDANIDADGGDGESPLGEAAKAGNIAIMKMLMDEGASINAKRGVERTPLMWAAAGSTAAVRLLAQEGASLDAQDKDGCTALICAAQEANASTISTLAELGAKLDLRDSLGRTALHTACVFDCAPGAEELLKAGADPNIADIQGVTPLMWAAANGLSRETCDWFVARGARLDAQDEKGKTALMRAAEDGRTESVRQLLRAGANAGLRDKVGRTAHDYALKPKRGFIKNPAIAPALQEAAAASGWKNVAETGTALQKDLSVSGPLRLRMGPKPAA